MKNVLIGIFLIVVVEYSIIYYNSFLLGDHTLVTV